MAVSGTRGPAYSESSSCHSGTLGEIKKFKMAAKMAAANVKNYKIVTTSLLIHIGETYFLHRYRFWHSSNMMGYICIMYNACQSKMATKMAAR